MGKKIKAQWKPVDVPESFLSDGFEGLIGIEELTDYQIENGKVVTPKPGKESKGKKKRKHKVKKNESLVVIPSKKRKIVKSEGDECVPLTNKQGKVASRKKKKDKCINVKIQNESVGVSEIVSGDQTYLDSIPPGMEAWACCHVPLPVIKALDELGFKEPTEIQALTLPAAIKGRRDILGAAETGSGKTLAFGIPIIHGIFMQKKREAKDARNLVHNSDSEDEESKGINKTEETHCSSTMKKRLYALILTPTRELAIQVRNHLIAMAKYSNVKVATVVGGMASQKQERLLKREPEIVVATPGRLWELIQEGNPHLQKVGDISFLAIDETDRMLEKGHFQELQNLLEYINSDPDKKEKRQTFVFSATLTLVHEPPKYANKGSKAALRVTPGQKLQQIISSLGITHPKVVDVTAQAVTASTLSEARIVCQIDEKDFYLYYFLQRHQGRTLVFCNSITCVRRLAQLLSVLQCRPLPLHANMQQRQRLKNLEHFRDSANSLLLATDVAARGLDIPNVEHVVHYQVPRTSELYVHRSGRTARAKKEGLTLILMEPKEINCYLQLCRTLGRDRDLPDFPVDDNVFQAIRARVILARKVDSIELQYRRKSAKANWFERAAEEMDIILDEDEIPGKYSEKESADVKKKTKALRKELQSLLDTPIFPKRLSFKYPNQMVEEKEEPEVKATEVIKNTKHKPGAYVRLAR